jgi:hypothetical protein
MVSVYALLCAATLMRSECTTATAIDVLRMPDANTELACLQDSMTMLGGLGIQPQGGEYWKIVCARHNDMPIVAESRRPDLSLVLKTPQLVAPGRPSTESPDHN